MWTKYYGDPQMIKKTPKINHPLYTFLSLEAKKRKLQDDVDQLLTGTYVCSFLGQCCFCPCRFL